MLYPGQTALITGASGGIGAAYARELAAQGADLILVARSEGKMTALAAQLRDRHHVRVDVVPTDLTLADAAETVATRVAELDRQVDILVNNAGFATYGDLVDSDPARLTAEVRLNCVTLVDLTTRFLPGMVTRRRGTVINVASTAAFQPLPHMAVYGATKAFVLSFTEALWAEARPAGVRVVAICPGSTRTEFFDVVGAKEAAVGAMRTPEQVVAATFKALRRGVPTVVDGRRNALLAYTTGMMPRRLVVRIAERTMRPRTPETLARLA
jgi:short-subunit dehydrogenase